MSLRHIAAQLPQGFPLCDPVTLSPARLIPAPSSFPHATLHRPGRRLNSRVRSSTEKRNTMAHKAVSLLVLCVLASATIAHGARPITPSTLSAETASQSHSPFSASSLFRMAMAAWNDGAQGVILPSVSKSDDSQAREATSSAVIVAPEVAPFEEDVDPAAADVAVSLPGSDNLIISRVHVKPAKIAEPADDTDDNGDTDDKITVEDDDNEDDDDDDVFSRLIANEVNEETDLTSVSLPGSDNVIAAIHKPRSHVASKPRSSFGVSLPGSDNEIVAFGVPATLATRSVVVATDVDALQAEATKEESVVVANDGKVTKAEDDSTFHVSLPGSDNEIWARNVPHRKSNVVAITDESDRDATTTTATATATTATASLSPKSASASSADDNTASVSLPGSDNVIQAFNIRGNKKKTTSFQVSLPGSDNVITAYGVPKRKGLTVVATEGAEVAEPAVAETTTAVNKVAEANATTDDVFTVSLPGSDNVIAALHVPHKRKFVVGQA
ncbi:unnamed protein product [Closterium sp. Yama58-4]|nr:unnamed protein product [Closterium sp. Yama58-4]